MLRARGVSVMAGGKSGAKCKGYLQDQDQGGCQGQAWLGGEVGRAMASCMRLAAQGVALLCLHMRARLSLHHSLNAFHNKQRRRGRAWAAA